MKPSILVIGAERGLGLGLVRVLFQRGWTVTGTARETDDASALVAIGAGGADRFSVARIDVTRNDQADAFVTALGDARFDVIFFNAGIFGPVHQSVSLATDAELTQIMLTNTFGPMRLAHRLVGHLTPKGTYAFMSSHRGSIAMNVEGGLELYRASKVASNMLARGLHVQYKERALTVLSIHPGWARTAMGTLDGTVEAEIELEESVTGVADVLDRHRGTGVNRYLDWRGHVLPW
jgi:NAD(P)-dependent dehydrogenase (short-subunit alcohol dehydrogenase family)